MAASPINYSQIYFDQRGAPYWLRQDGSKVFLPPLSAAQSNNPRAVEWARRMGVSIDGVKVTNQSAPGSSFLRERGHWNADKGQWDQDVNWNNILATAVGGQIAAPYVAGALAGGSTLPSSQIPNAHLAVPGQIASQGASQLPSAAAAASAGSQAASGGVLPSSSIPGLHEAIPAPIGSQGVSPATVAALGNTAANGAKAASGASGFGKELLDKFLSPEGVIGLAGLIPAITGMGQNNVADDPRIKEQMDLALERQRMENQRYKRVDPLHEAVTRLTYSMMPISARNG